MDAHTPPARKMRQYSAGPASTTPGAGFRAANSAPSTVGAP